VTVARAKSGTVSRPRVALGDDGSLGFTWEERGSTTIDIALAVMSTAREVPTPVRLMRAENPLRPEIVSTGTDFAVAWSEGRIWKVFTSTITPEAVTPFDPDVPPLMGDLAWNGSSFGIVFMEYRDGCSYVYGTRAARTGLGEMRWKLSTTDCMVSEHFDAIEPAIARRQDGDFAVVWADERGSGGLYFARLSIAGADRPVMATSLTQSPALASNLAGRLGVTWRDGPSTTAMFMVLDDDGAPVTEPMPLGMAGAVPPSIAWSGRAWVVAWMDGSFWVQVAWLDENGELIESRRVAEGDASTDVSVTAAPAYAAIVRVEASAKLILNTVCAPCAVP